MSIQIYILGILAEENSYPYMLKKKLSEPIPIDQFTGISESKLYYHFEKLAGEGHIEPVETIKTENRPDKHIYQITDKGREELTKRIYQVFEKAEQIQEMYIALTNIKHVDIDRVTAILERKLEQRRRNWETYLSFDPQLDEGSDKYFAYAYIKEHAASRMSHVNEWMEILVERLKALAAE